MLSQHFSQIERFKIIGTTIGTDKSLGADKLVYNHMLVPLSVHKWEHTHIHIHTHTHTHTHTIPLKQSKIYLAFVTKGVRLIIYQDNYQQHSKTLNIQQHTNNNVVPTRKCKPKKLYHQSRHTNRNQKAKTMQTCWQNQIRPEKIFMFAVSRPSLLKSTNTKLFLQRSAKTYRRLF